MGDQSPSVSVCFFVFYLLIIFLHLAQVETKPQPKCPKEFLCSNRSIPTFPFTNKSLPDCGLFKLGCNVVSTPPTLELDGKLYNTLALGEEDLVVLSDPVLSDHLKNRSCDSFNWNSSTSFTNSSSISFEVPKSQFLFLFKCNQGSSHHSRQKLDDYFKGYKSYRKCKNVTLYYKENHHIIPKNKVPKDCSLVQLPFDNSTKSNNLFEELTPEIIFFWKVSEKCSECHSRGGRCQTNSNNNFKCSEDFMTISFGLRESAMRMNSMYPDGWFALGETTGKYGKNLDMLLQILAMSTSFFLLLLDMVPAYFAHVLALALD
nr:LEAF RUST 10 DISEASE-RESISTANCE LOCUS RECEPTOR-LIKE PROTEIN KINASE-like 1.1 [Ipomoea batatas]